jgi:hypothetical protein
MLVTRIGKDTIRWNGHNRLTAALFLIRHVGMYWDLDRIVKERKESELVKMVKQEVVKQEPSEQAELDLAVASILEKEADDDDHFFSGKAATAAQNKYQQQEGKHTLAICHKFIMLFLVGDKVSLARNMSA